jgi:hypothetical protein
MSKEEGKNRDEKAKKDPETLFRRFPVYASSDLSLCLSRFSWLSDPTVHTLLPSTFLVRYSAVPAVVNGTIRLTASPRSVFSGA